ncbi:serine hydrolase [Actinoplanes italicus]|uniref:D-alanyl-D-alanine carboxypeptidase n=1 Tax=Actinoplanes italicus TaxID=113567 RepID=A0A2T0JLF4_9ACTN|nr:serine hydrolase domain-containing protein [Actinoplanes italicus]PRX08434.1 D-alanyl-D-alanine carboxypeptidase [Actinoplanes italicus]GIE36682.1 serine hydrolase [Actinoplanes italicus]
MFSFFGRPAHGTQARHGRRRGVVTAVVAAVATAGVAAAGAASAGAFESEQAPIAKDQALQSALDGLVKDGSLPGVLMSVRSADGRVTDYTAGVGDTHKKSAVPADGYVRIASNTKMYTAVIILQLVGEGKIALTDTVEKHLPGVVRGTGAGAGIDGRKMTVQQLLQHTTGLGNDTSLNVPGGILAVKDRYFEPRELLDSALAQPPASGKGKARVWSYSNSGYVVLGLVAQRVTGRPFAELVNERIIKRIGLTETYYPGPGDRDIRAPHPQGYLPAKDAQGKPTGRELIDITRFDPSVAGAAGQMIATPSDVNKFMIALQDGRLINPRELAKMRETVEAPGLPEGWRYGLGTIEFKLSCGITAYGHGGDADGFQSRAAITADGRAVTLVGTNDEAGQQEVLGVFDKALCATT